MAPGERRLIANVRRERLTYLSAKKLASLARTCHSIEEARLPGIFVEAGCAKGGSTILIASVKSLERPLYVYDVFGMIPAPTREDPERVHGRYREIVEGRSRGIGGDTYYGYIENLYEVVRSNLRRFGVGREEQSVWLVKGLIDDTMSINEPVAFAHIDVDWYQPVMTCLTRIAPRLVVGGSIVVDDYHDWDGCRKATDEFLRQMDDRFVLDDSAGSMKLTRVQV